MYISANFDKFKHIYDIKRLRQYSDMCERDNEWIENEKIYGPYEHEKTFSGRERHSALKYASELARKYNCEIERKGFNAGKI